MMPSESILRAELAISKASGAVKLPWTMAVMCVSRSSPCSDSCIWQAKNTSKMERLLTKDNMDVSDRQETFPAYCCLNCIGHTS